MPILSANALWDHTLSTLTPSTSASSVSNCFMSFTKQACSFVQTGLQSSGYHISTTFFFPANSDNFTSCLSWFSNVKSGATSPTEMLMILPPECRKLSQASYRIWLRLANGPRDLLDRPNQENPGRGAEQAHSRSNCERPEEISRAVQHEASKCRGEDAREVAYEILQARPPACGLRSGQRL